ncbi:hypothetical protein R1flu_012086 [Riccia fluitans]|uniref:Uncharacterized protein n=1 Tax=Riccia fluitans TaxID=41844 RepID=A0ABD1ZAS4_9MARC
MFTEVQHYKQPAAADDILTTAHYARDPWLVNRGLNTQSQFLTSVIHGRHVRRLSHPASHWSRIATHSLHPASLTVNLEEQLRSTIRR